MKDFLAFHGNSLNFNFKILCETLADMGYSVDLSDEKSALSFDYDDNYKFIISCAHSENLHYKFIINLIRKKYSHVPLILFDDTDWNRKTMKFAIRPFIVFKREFNGNTKKIRGVSCFQMPKIVHDNYHPEIEKIYDVSFVGTTTSKSRAAFFEKIRQLKKENWLIHETKHAYDMPYDEYIKIINQSKISLSCFGNGYDTIRYWEIISCKTAILSPKVPLYIPDDLTEEEAVFFREDMSDLEGKIDYLLENNRWQTFARKGYEAFERRHSNIKRTEYFLTKIEEVELFNRRQASKRFSLSRYFDRFLESI